MSNETAPYVPTYTTMDGVDDVLTIGSVLPLLRLTKGLIIARGAAQVERQVGASWGASTYRHGGLMTGIEHIMYRHGFNSGFSNVSRFARGTRVRDISNYVDAALRYGRVTSAGPGAYIVEGNIGRVIGTDIAGKGVSNIRVIVRDGIIQTAFPF